MARQQLTKRRRRVVKLAHEYGITGFCDSEADNEIQGLAQVLTKIPEEILDEMEQCLRDFAALQESLRSLN